MMFHTLRSHVLLNTQLHIAPTSWVGTTAPLAQVQRGTRARIVQVEEGQRLRKRLADLGLAVGMEVRILHEAHGRGPMILAVRNDTRLALGWGLASKITVCIEG